ncbi:hypothetical protein C8Q73DRAFT_146075 [Cubamyces lactineus]|nr:hypothetical protein C8Q73DRAFT_146075 [Cubamyces lactineus]
MDTLKRIFSKGKASKPGPRIKLYCKYPGCGRPFYPEHKIDCFCSPECLQDYNYTPPSHWFANIPSIDPVQRRWWFHKRNASMPMPVQRSASIAILNPTPRRSIRHRRKHSERPAGSPTAHGFVSPSGQHSTQHAARSGVRPSDYATKPLPRLPLDDHGRPPVRGYGGAHHDTNTRSYGRHVHRHDRDHHRTGAHRPHHEQRTTNHTRSPSASVHGFMQQELVLVHQYAGVDERGFPYTVPVMMDPASAEAYRRRPPQIPLPPIPTQAPAPTPHSTARRRSGAMTHHGPRPRSNSFGGFHYAARA